MAHDDPFTIDLFGNTALSSGLGLGVTAFAGDFTPEPDDDDDPDPSTPAPAIAGVKASRAASPGSRTRGENFHIVGDRVLAKGWKARARDNIAAIRLAAEIEAAERPATRAEQEKLIRFTGLAHRILRTAFFVGPARSISARAGMRSARRLRTPSGKPITPRSPAARSTPISRQSSSFGRSGQVSSVSAGAAAVFLSRESALACFRC